MLEQPIRIQAIRFQYRGRPERRGNWETMPFYLNHLRQFLVDYDGDVVWLKGHTGGDEAAYLVFNTAIVDDVRSLVTRPLPELGVYTLTGEKEPVEILRKYYREGKIGVGRLVFWEEQVGESSDELIRKASKGFWLPAPNTPEACNGATLIKARKAMWHLSGGKWGLQLEEVEETVCRSDGTMVHVKKSPELWLPHEAAKLAKWQHDPIVAVAEARSE